MHIDTRDHPDGRITGALLVPPSIDAHDAAIDRLIAESPAGRELIAAGFGCCAAAGDAPHLQQPVVEPEPQIVGLAEVLGFGAWDSRDRRLLAAALFLSGLIGLVAAALR